MARSHYIPQFILRNFCKDNVITYFDLQKNKAESRNTRSVFSEEGYYPEVLEKALCEKIETQFALLMNSRILESRYKITLTEAEMLILKKYLLITVFRTKSDESELMHSDLTRIQIDELMGDFYENLNKILECKTKEELFEYIDIENQRTNLTLFSYLRDILFSYTVFVSSSHSGEDFIIPDEGFAFYEGIGKNKKLTATLKLVQETNDPLLIQIVKMLTPHDYSVFPISRTLAIITMSPFYKLCMDNSPYKVKFPDEAPSLSKLLGFGNKDKVKPPKLSIHPQNGLEYICEIASLNRDDVFFLNSLLITNAKKHFACADMSSAHAVLRNQEDINEKNPTP
jgi:hypothetical protein